MFITEYREIHITVGTDNCSFTTASFFQTGRWEITLIGIFVNCVKDTPIEIMAVTIWASSFKFAHVPGISAWVTYCRLSAYCQNGQSIFGNTILNLLRSGINTLSQEVSERSPRQQPPQLQQSRKKDAEKEGDTGDNRKQKETEGSD